VALALAGSGAARARTASPAMLTVTAEVVDQTCQANGNFVDVTLSATAQSSSEVRGFKWDFTNDGTFDTRLMQDPTVVHTYPDEVRVTAKVVAKNVEGDRAKDKITFRTLRCP
jgi:PKD repeat protein